MGSFGRQGRTGLNTIHRSRDKDTEPQLPSGASRSTNYPVLWACPMQKGAEACTSWGKPDNGVLQPQRSLTPPSTKSKHHRPCNPLTQPVGPFTSHSGSTYCVLSNVPCTEDIVNKKRPCSDGTPPTPTSQAPLQRASSMSIMTISTCPHTNPSW